MSFLAKTLLNAKLKIVEFVDFTLLPLYEEKREQLFESLGVQPMTELAEMMEMEEDDVESVTTEITSDEMPLTPQGLALEALNENLSSAIWVKRDSDPFSQSEYIIKGLAVQEGAEGNNQFLVLLQDRFSSVQQPVPLFVLLEKFQPLRDLTVQDHHS